MAAHDDDTQLPDTIGDALRDASIDRFDEVDRDRYDMLGELARGGLGRIYRARDPRTGRIVAIKEVLQPSPDIVRRFVREAMVTANLQHPSIVPVYEVGRWPGGEPFYAMKLVEGRTLDALIHEARTWGARLELLPHVIAVADALAYAHAEHVIHRDLKPANILVGSYGETVVIDWGLARNLATGEELGTLPPSVGTAQTLPPEAMTIAGAIVGTPAYMSPEQAQGRTLDERADVYAIGAILYHALGGRRPFADAETLEDLIESVATRTPRPLAQLQPELPRELLAIVETAMARDPAARYATAAGLAADLRRYLGGQLVAAHRYTAWQLMRRWIAKHRAIVAVGAAALVALVVVGVVSVRRVAEERDEASRQRATAERARGVAQEARSLAERRFADSLEELGRQTLLQGNPDRALPLFAGAAGTRTDVPPALAVLIGEVRRAYAGLVALAPGTGSNMLAGDLSSDGSVIFTSDTAGTLRAWDVVAGRERWHAEHTPLFTRSPDGASLLCMDGDAGLVLRDAATGDERQRWSLAPLAMVGGARERPSELVWAGSGDRFAISTTAGRIALGTAGEATLTTVPAAGAKTWAIELSPAGTLLSVCGADGAVLRDATTGAVTATLREGTGDLYRCTWMDPSHLLTGGADGIARLWNVTTRAVERRFAHGGDIYGFVPAGAALVVLGDGDAATLWDVASGTLRARLLGHRLSSNDGAIVAGALVTVDEAGTIYGWDLETGVRLLSLPAEGTVSWIRGRGDRLLVFGEGRARVWQLQPGVSLQRIGGHTARVRTVAFAADGTVWTASNDGTARGTDPTGGRAVRVLGAGAPPFREPPVVDPTSPAATIAPNPRGLRSLTLSPDGTLAVTAGELGELVVWDVASGTERARWTGHTGRAREVVFARDGKLAYSAGDRTLRRWDVATGRALGSAPLGDAAWDVQLIADDRVVVTLTESGTLALWEATAFAPITPAVAVNKLRELVVADGLVVGGSPTGLYVLDAKGAAVATTTHASAFAVDVATTADGQRWVVASSARGDVVLFDASKPPALPPVRSWRASDELVATVRFRRGGDVLATSSGRRVRLWDPRSGRLLAESPLLAAMVTQLTWSPDGRQLAISGLTGDVWLWDLSPGASTGLDALARCVSPWQLADSALVAVTAPFDPAACAAVLSAAPRSR